MSFDQKWETDVYQNNLQINRYPFEHVVSTVYRYFGSVTDRLRINILEVGCGTANNIAFLAQEGFSATGIDGSERAIELGRSFLAEAKLKANLSCQDFTNLSNFHDQSFDMVIDRGAITHNQRVGVEKAISEAHRVLKKEGIFLSHIFSAKHSAIQYGEPIGDGSFHSFRGGVFDDCSFVFFFASERDIVELYESRFTLLSKVHNISQETLSHDDYRAMWHLICQK